MFLDDSARAEIKRVVEYAKTHKVDYDRVKGMMTGMLPPIDSQSRYAAVVMGHRCIFAIEEQPLGWCLHLSVLAQHGIEMHDLNLLMMAFGFHGTVDLAASWLDAERSINIVEPCGH